MDDLVQWLRTQLDEDERIARRGYYSDTHWELFTTQAHLTAWQAWRELYPHEQWNVGANDRIADAARDRIREQITAHEADRTERMLREIDAKRRIVDRYAWLREHGDTGGTAWVLPLLALPYSDRPGYRDDWRP